MAEPQSVAAEAPAQGASPPEPGTPEEPTGASGGEPTQVDKAPSPPNDLRSLQARLTIQATALAAVRDKLGLPKSTPDQEISKALDAVLTPKPPGLSEDPAVEAQWQRIRDQQWSWVERTYGSEAANAVRHIRDLALTTDDPEAMAAAFWAAREASGLTPPASTSAAPAEPQAPAQEQEEPPDLEVGESTRNDLGIKPIPADITRGLERTGNVKAAVRKLFGGSAGA